MKNFWKCFQTKLQRPSFLQNRQHQGLLAVLLGGLLITGAGLASGVAWHYITETWPTQTLTSLATPQWRGLNADLHAFHSPQDFKTAELKLLKITLHSPLEKSVLPHYLLGKLYDTLDRRKDAIREYHMAISGVNHSWINQLQYRHIQDNALSNLALICYRNNQNKAALAILHLISDNPTLIEPDLTTALHDSLENPARGDFHLVLGQELRHQLWLDKARQEFQQAKSLGLSPQLQLEANHWLQFQMPKHIEALTPLARYYSLAGSATSDTDKRQAATFYEKALRLNPQFEWDYQELAILYRDFKDYPRANAYARQAIALNAGFYNPYLTLGDLAVDQAKYANGIAWYQTASNLIQVFPAQVSDPLLANVENQIGYAYESLNNQQEAIAHYRQAMVRASESDGSEDPEANSSDEDYEYARSAVERISMSYYPSHTAPSADTLSSL